MFDNMAMPGIWRRPAPEPFRAELQGAWCARRTEPAGTGRGLAIVSDIAKAHRGQVTIEVGNSGVGTLVTVCFPECYDSNATLETARSQKL